MDCEFHISSSFLSSQGSILTRSTVHISNYCTCRPDVYHCLVVQTPLDKLSKNKPSTSTTHVACKSKLLSFVRSYMYMHPCLGNWVAIGRVVVYITVLIFSAGIKCRQYMLTVEAIGKNRESPQLQCRHLIPALNAWAARA